MSEGLGNRLLAVYAGVITAVLGLVVMKAAPTNQDFDQITVHRIRVVEPNGTLRMVISNHDQVPHDSRGNAQGQLEREGAGIIFYNDEGSENGGLIFGGRKGADGKIMDSGVSLSFDKYGVPAQVVQLAGIGDSTNQFAGLRIRDARQNQNANRVWVGNADDGTAQVALMDTQGRRRIVMEVQANGTSSLTFLDANGQVVNRMAPR